MKHLFSRNAALAAAVAIAPLLLGFALGLDSLRDLWRALAVCLAVGALVYRDELELRADGRTELVAGALVGAIAGAGLSVVYAAWWNHMNMGEYDFFALYMDARIAFERLDFYEPANYQSLYASMPAPFADMHPGFKRNVLEVGTKYPPPSMLYLMPFGALERLPAHIAWVGTSWLAIAACIGLAWRGVFRSHSLVCLLAVAALVLAYPGTKLTVSLEQMHFTALALLLGAILLRHKAMTGLLIGVGTLIKPPVAALSLYLLYARHWSAFAVLVVSAIVLCALSIVVFGWDVFARFFVDNPNLRVSNSLYYEDMNRSLQGTVVRAFNWDFSQGTPMRHPVFLGAAVAITAVTGAACWIARGQRNLHVLALLICFGLLLYPGTQRHYAVLLLAPLLLQIVLADRDGWPRWLIAGGAAAVALTSVSHTLWATLALWLALFLMICMRRGVD